MNMIEKRKILYTPVRRYFSMVCLIAIGLMVLFPQQAHADFKGMNHGARAYALGNAYTALSDDPTALFWNPAGLTRVKQYSFTMSHQNLYGISGLNSEMIALAMPLPYIRTGFAWTQVCLDGEYYEDVFHLGGASIVWLGDVPVRFGATLKYSRVSVPGYADAKEVSKADLDLGMQVQPVKSLTFSLVTRNILRPEFKLVEEGDKLDRQYVAGACYSWKDIVNFLADYQWEGGDSQLNLGCEMWFYNVFAPRIGLSGENLTAGFGLKSSWWSLDGAVYQHNELGSTYRLTFGLRFDMDDFEL